MMPTPVAKLGLMSFGIVFGGALLLTGAFLGVAFISKSGGNSNSASEKSVATSKEPTQTSEAPLPPPTLDLKKSAQERQDYDFEYVRRHKWWKKALTEKRLNEIISQAISSNSGNHLWMTRDGRTEITKIIDEIALVPEKFKGQDVARYDIQGIKRPDKQSVLMGLIIVLDSREFRDGPGR